ncbi:MAG: putative toxin-antitoxin system antitoxin component (TIGR02293 family) [Cryomorphaceae bacterium]|jgi:putative toxin-antitoxin system antitoxin component (TIGR02293 family)
MSLKKQAIPKSYPNLQDLKPMEVKEVAIAGKSYTRFSHSGRMKAIREKMPYHSLESLSERSGLSIKLFLEKLEMPQTTYNKKKRENGLLDRRDSELVLVLAEVLDYGLEVFNDEKEKFQRWLKKVNYSLGGVSPDSLFDSITGVEQVKNALDRIEHGVFA